MKGLDVGSLSGRPRPGIALEPELAGVIWAKPYEAARIARSHVIAYTTRFPDGVFLRTETPRRRSGSGLLPFSSPEPDRDRWATRQLSAGPPGCIRRPSRLGKAYRNTSPRETVSLSHGWRPGYRRNWGGGSPAGRCYFSTAAKGCGHRLGTAVAGAFSRLGAQSAAGSWNAWGSYAGPSRPRRPSTVPWRLSNVMCQAGRLRREPALPRRGRPEIFGSRGSSRCGWRCLLCPWPSRVIVLVGQSAFALRAKRMDAFAPFSPDECRADNPTVRTSMFSCEPLSVAKPTTCGACTVPGCSCVGFVGWPPEVIPGASSICHRANCGHANSSH
jgi:hypothetical protein